MIKYWIWMARESWWMIYAWLTNATGSLLLVPTMLNLSTTVFFIRASAYDFRVLMGMFWVQKTHPNKTVQLSQKSLHVLITRLLNNTRTLMLLRLTSTRSGSFLFTLNRVSSTSVELGSSSGTGLYWVHWMTPATWSHHRRLGERKTETSSEILP